MNNFGASSIHSRSSLVSVVKRPYVAAATVLTVIGLAALALSGCGSANAIVPVPVLKASAGAASGATNANATTAPTTTPPATAKDGAAKDGDIDGDGNRDSITVTPGQSTIRVAMTTLGAQTFTFNDMSSYSLTENHLPKLTGTVDADADGHAEVFIQTDQGASTGALSMLKLVNGKLARVTLDDAPLALSFSGSMGHLAGFSCAGGSFKAFWTYSAAGNAGQGPYTGEITSYKFNGAALVKTAFKTETYDYSNQDKFGSYGHIDCGSLQAPALQ